MNGRRSRRNGSKAGFFDFPRFPAARLFSRLGNGILVHRRRLALDVARSELALTIPASLPRTGARFVQRSPRLGSLSD